MQFSLLGMMVLTTVLAVVCAVAFSLPSSVGAILVVLLQPCLIAGLIVGAFYGQDDLRAFCLGGLVPFVQSIIPGSAGMNNWSSYLTMLLTQRSFANVQGRARMNQSVDAYYEQIVTVLDRIGPTLMLSIAAFIFASMCCGFTGVFVRRWIARRSVA